MSGFRRALPSLSALATFESAARLGSFTLAASELGVTQAAVSRQIKSLEDDLHAPLFVRAHRKVTLTQNGAALAGVLTSSFGRIADMVETLRQPRLEDTVTVGATLAFTHFWLLPRLSGFRTTFPDIRLKLVGDDAMTDLRRDRLDVAVRYGVPPFADGRSLASLRDEIVPVCSPALLAAHGMTADTADLARLPLIASDWVNPTWLTWRTWARGVGLADQLGRAPDASALRFNHYTDTIQAAITGQGVALGWVAILSDLIAQGQLVRLGTQSLSQEDRYHAILPLGRDPSPGALVFMDWLSGQFATNP